jgi:hypothetical protein
MPAEVSGARVAAEIINRLKPTLAVPPKASPVANQGFAELISCLVNFGLAPNFSSGFARSLGSEGIQDKGGNPSDPRHLQVPLMA